MRFHRWLALLGAGTLALPAPAASTERIYIGTDSRGIWLLQLNPADGSLSRPELAADAAKPGFLAQDPSGSHLYAVGQLRPGPGLRPGECGVSAFAVSANGRLDYLNQQRSGTSVPPHLAVDASGRMLIAADYAAGTVCAWPIRADGSLGAMSARVYDRGPVGPNRDRQRGAHPHSVTLSPDNRLAYVCDLGLDRVFTWRIDPARAGLAPDDPPFTAAPPGSGPRHSKLSPDGRFLYVVDEMGGSICVFARDPRGALALTQTISTLPPLFGAVNLSAEIRLDRAGRFVYASNRGPDTLAVFARNAANGALSLVEIVSCGGRQPRNFNLSPDGRWLVCANRASNSVTVLRIDPLTGRLRLTPFRADLNQPICVLFSKNP